MRRRTFFKLIGLAPAVALVKPQGSQRDIQLAAEQQAYEAKLQKIVGVADARVRRLIHADDIVSDGFTGGIQFGQITLLTYTDIDGNTDLTALHDGDTQAGGVEYIGT